MFEILNYDARHAAAWDDFVGASRNGTFLLRRGFMDYHADRFCDHSLLFFKDGRLRAVLPANVVADTLYSHQGLTYGGLIADAALRTAETINLFKTLNDRLREEGIRRVVYKPIPWIYAPQPCEEDLYALTTECKARLVAREISSAVCLDGMPAFSELRRRGARKAQKSGVTVVESEDLAAFWRILTETLESRHDTAPVHTLEEMALLRSRFPENIRLFAALHEGRMVGGTVIFADETAVHAQYIAASPEGRQLGALDLIFTRLITNTFAAHRYFDFGKSTECAGAFLNEGLIAQKEGFGARGICYDTYEWNIR